MAEGLSAWSHLATAWPVECSPAWLDAEHGRITERHYITVVDNDGLPVAAASWLLLTGDEERRGYTTYDLLLGTELETSLRLIDDRGGDWDQQAVQLRRVLAPAALVPCASVTIPSTNEPAVIWDQRMGEPVVAAALARLIAAVWDAALALSARSIVFTNVPTTSTWAQMRLELDRAGYTAAAQSPSTSINIPADGIDGFLARMPRRQRKNRRREMRIFHESTDGVTVHSGARLLDDDIVDLLHGRYAKYGLGTSRISVVDRMTRAQVLPDVTVLVAERDGRACAFKAVVADHRLDRLVSRFSGCEENNFFAYFNIVFYEPLRYGAANGFATMILGTEAYRAKVERGAVVEPRHAYLRCADRSLRSAVNRASELRGSVEQRRLRAELSHAHE